MKKTGFLIVMLVLALGALGVGYAKWDQTLAINGKVSTGTYDIIFSDASATPDSHGVATLTGPTIKDSAHQFDVAVANAYPSFVQVVNFIVTNNGTVPAKIGTVTVTNDNSANFDAKVLGIADGEVLDVGESQNATLTITLDADAQETLTNLVFTVEITSAPEF